MSHTRFPVIPAAFLLALLILAVLLGSLQAQNEPNADTGGACVGGAEGERCYGPGGAVSKVLFDADGNPASQEKFATGFASLTATTAVIDAAQDNTLYESETGALSNGAGQHLFAGKTGGSLIRRGLLAFDVQGALPAGATIVSAEVDLHMSKTNSGDKEVALHKVLKEWGEGASNADGNEGAGAAAETGDATWLHTFFNSANWDTTGGDFMGPESASTTVGGVGSYRWSSPQLADDVQAWLDGSAANAGWLVLGDESEGGTAKRFDSRENPDAAKRPKLTVTYIAFPADHFSFVPIIQAAD